SSTKTQNGRADATVLPRRQPDRCCGWRGFLPPSTTFTDPPPVFLDLPCEIPSRFTNDLPCSLDPPSGSSFLVFPWSLISLPSRDHPITFTNRESVRTDAIRPARHRPPSSSTCPSPEHS